MSITDLRRWLRLLALACALLTGTTASARDGDPARAVLEQAAEAMGGLDRLRSLDNVVLTGFGQRVYYDGGGFLTGEKNVPPKWISVTDAQRTFDLPHARALNQERRSMEFPFAGFFGLNFARNATMQTGDALLDHPLPALLAALDDTTQLGAVSEDEDGVIVVQFTPAGAGSPAWLGIDARTHLPAFSRWIVGHPNLGDVTYTAYFTAYLPFDGVQLPMGLMNKMDWRDQVSLMFQVDSYRIDVPKAQLPSFPETASMPTDVPVAKVIKLADGVWDVRTGTAGGPVVEFGERLVMFEAYGGEAQTLARIDAANKLVRGKKVEAVIVSHHHFDHTGGIRAAVSRGLEVISQRGNEGIIREMVTRPAVYYPDELARHPHELVFRPVDEKLVLEDARHRLEIYRTIEHSHMPNGVFAYLPKERIMMEGDFGDESWQLHFWGSALAENIKHYGIDPVSDVAVHGSGLLSIAQTLANDQKQIDATMEWCKTTEAGGRYAFGCPVQYDAQGPVPLTPR